MHTSFTPTSRSGRLAYYVDHRDPHAAARAERLLPHLPDDTTLLLNAPALLGRFPSWSGRVIDLSDAARTQTADEARLLDWVSRGQPSVLLCDALFEGPTLQDRLPRMVRLRRPGFEDEERLQRQYGNAAMTLALAPHWFESRQTPEWLRRKTQYVGCLPHPNCAEVERRAARRTCGFEDDQRYVVVLKSGAHDSFSLTRVAAAAAHCPTHQWVRLGPVAHTDAALPGNLQQVGMVPDADTYLRAADVVVSDAEVGLLHRVASCCTPLVCLPDPDARHAQHTYAHALRRRGLALTFDRFPAPYQWPGILRRADKLNALGWKHFYADNPSDRVAAFLRTIARA